MILWHHCYIELMRSQVLNERTIGVSQVTDLCMTLSENSNKKTQSAKASGISYMCLVSFAIDWEMSYTSG